MEALNAATLTPLSVLCDRRKKPLKFSPPPRISASIVSDSASFPSKKPSLKEYLPSGLRGGLLLAASVINGGIAKALTYEEALQQSAGSPSSGDLDVNGVIDSVISFGTENAVIIAGGLAILGVPLVLSQVLNKPKPWGVESAKNAYAKLGTDGDAQLLDIRALTEFRQVGTPDVRGLKKKSVSITYRADDKPGFLKKLALKFKEPENTTLFILDKFDGNSELVAELVTVNGFKAAYAIKDGAEGPRGWMKSGLPWTPPRKALSLDLSNFTESITGAIGETSDGLALTLGIAAATGLGLLAFTEIETILQLVGSAAIVQFATKKLLFAEDRKRTLKQVDEFLNTKIAPKELVDEITQIGKALLPTSTDSKALPAPTEATPEPAPASSTVQKAEASPDTVSESKVDAAAEPVPEVNSVPKPEVKAESVPGIQRPLSPYPYYPDFKPPTSPTPSQP
ncbi:rhodanese-like domain-containing protein 4, chloroplastic [Prosopis cineraria]|uniref:rhodanese-like domain-containing protein 4, chloroplastic n=1 Tax=Prosopis cineraria TaxID=364024 RepID=UPI00240F9732|nr:rhodanese-like domain-containing protein 4, chloroplastic [Prosopis cineraria]